MRSILSVLLFLASVQVAVAGLWEDLRFVNIPAGSFEMGSPHEGYRDERPVHSISISGFLMMDHELTIGEINRLIKLHPKLITRKLTNPMDEFMDQPTASSSDNDQLPVIVTYAEAEAIAAKMSKLLGKTVRLPTEPEWEYAARGGLNQKQYPWGSSQDIVGKETVQSLVDRVTDGCALFRPMPVGPVRSISPSNAYGLYDMAGHAWEWTSSAYRTYPYKPQEQGRTKKSASDSIVIRGGGAVIEGCDVRVALRGFTRSDSRFGVRFVTEK